MVMIMMMSSFLIKIIFLVISIGFTTGSIMMTLTSISSFPSLLNISLIIFMEASLVRPFVMPISILLLTLLLLILLLILLLVLLLLLLLKLLLLALTMSLGTIRLVVALALLRIETTLLCVGLVIVVDGSGSNLAIPLLTIGTLLLLIVSQLCLLLSVVLLETVVGLNQFAIGLLQRIVIFEPVFLCHVLKLHIEIFKQLVGISFIRMDYLDIQDVGDVLL